MGERRIPAREEVLAYLHEEGSGDQWGEYDQVDAFNVSPPATRVTKVVACSDSPVNSMVLF